MIYITGANGWLGLNLIESLTNNETSKWGFNSNEKIRAFVLNGTNRKEILKISSNVEIIEGDLTNQDDIDFFLSGCNDGILFHTAGIIHPKKVKSFNDINFRATLDLISKAYQNKIKKTVIISSNSPCGCNPTNSMSDIFNEESNYNPYMGYGKSKMLMEKAIIQKFGKSNLNYTIIRAPWFYGPHQPKRQKLFFEMIRKGKGPIVGDGQNLRSMVFTKNLVQGMILSVSHKMAFQKIYWIADKKPYSMNFIINTIENVMIEEFRLECKMKRLKLPFFISQVAQVVDFCLQKIGLYHQKIHVLSEMNKNIACTVDLAINEIGYNPEVELREGMKISLNEIYSK